MRRRWLFLSFELLGQLQAGAAASRLCACLLAPLKIANDFRFMNEHYLISKFEQFERDNSWEELFHKINIWSDEQEKNLSLTYDVSNCFENMEKNRYRNVLPYDQNRVVLKETGQLKTDYINASPLNMPATKHNYILTQGPLASTSEDFWQMVYEQNAQIVIMLSKVMEKNFIKCFSYFPSKDEPLAKFDLFKCKWLGEEVKQNYIYRKMCLSPCKSSTTDSAVQNSFSASLAADECESACVQGKSRIIHHFQFVTWPDFGVPEHTDHFLEFLEHVRSISLITQTSPSENQILPLATNTATTQPAPIVCHCSAGIGRTGTFVIVNSILSILSKKRDGSVEEQLLPAPPKINLVENEVVSATNHVAQPENNDIVSVEDNSAEEQALKETTEVEAKDSKNKRKKIKQKGGPTVEVKQPPRELEPLDDIVSDMVVFIRKSRMGLIQTPSQLRFCWKAIVDWIKKEEQKEAQESLFLETEKKKSRNSDQLPTSSCTEIINNTNASLEFRREKVRQIRERLRDVEKRKNAGVLSRLIYSFHKGYRGSFKNALFAAGSATVVVVFSIVIFLYFSRTEQEIAIDVRTDL